MVAPITPGEVVEAVRRVRVGRQGGPDEVRPEFIKWAGEEALTEVAGFFSDCTRNKAFPTQWTQAEVVGIFKKGDTFDPANYRPISLLNMLYKLYASIVADRLRTWADGILRETQYGFRRN
eukprot:13351868-Alexandrium_andersonii.AAC.1